MSTPNLAKAFLAAQGQMDNASKDGVNPHFHSKYATLQSVRAAVLPALTANDLMVLQGFEPASVPDAGVVIVTHLIHVSGEKLESRLFVPASKKDPQGFGSAITYGRRYALAAICGIGSDEDDDGNLGSDRPAPRRETPPPNPAPAQRAATPPAPAQQAASNSAPSPARKDLGDRLMRLAAHDKDRAKGIMMALINGKASPSVLTDFDLELCKIILESSMVEASAKDAENAIAIIGDTKQALLNSIGTQKPMESWTKEHLAAAWKAVRPGQVEPGKPGSADYKEECPF